MISTRTALLVGTLLVMPLPAQNLLTNGDFELGGLTGWSTFGSVFPEANNPPQFVPRNGNEMCSMFGNFSGGFNVSGMFQQFPASAGEQFTMDAWSRHWSGDPLTGTGAPNFNWAVMKIAFFDVGGTEIGSVESTILDGNSPTDFWLNNVPITGTAPAGTANVQALVMILQPGLDGGALHVDDVSFSRATGGAPTITIESVPAYGTSGFMTGRVSGVNFATHSVAAYIYIDGAGWWTKPSAVTRTVPINPDGTFSAQVTTCCLDSRATIYRAALISSSLVPPLAAGSCGTAQGLTIANDYFERYGRTIQFAGRTWAVKDAPSAVGPGGNLFTDDSNDVFVDAQGRLHLRVVNKGGQWWCSEVVLLDDVGYGTYWFTTESQVGSLDHHLTFGAFTWDPYCDDTTIPAWPNREIDFEDSRWGNPGDPTNGQVVVQPWTVPGNTVRYTTPTLSPTPTLTRYFTWTPSRVDFGVVKGLHSTCTPPPANVIHTSTYFHNPGSGQRVPPEGREKFRFNLWINTGSAPSNGQTAEIIISDFRFSPAEGTFVGGCGVNPPGSATVLSGAPTLGNTVTLGVDNPAGTQRVGANTILLLSAAAIPGFPCGLQLPGFGMTGPTGELLVNPAPPVISVPGGAWTGAGNPVPFPIAIPNVTALIGQSVYAQGILIDPGGPVPVGLADAVELCVRA